MAAGSYWMSQMNLGISPGQAVWPRVVLIIGLATCFVPTNVAAYLYTPLAMRGARGRPVEPTAQRGRQRRNLACSDGAGAPRSVSQPPSWRVSGSLQRGVAFLSRSVISIVPAADQRSDRSAANGFADARELAPAASALAYFDVFWVLAVVMVALVFVVPLMKRSVAEKGARIGGE
jgi:DHA2 family multidrug resistance protein